MGDFESFESAEDALNELLNQSVADPYDDKEEARNDYLNAARDRVLSALTTLRSRSETAERERDEARAEVLRTVRELNDSRTETEQAAASERAAIVAMLRKDAEEMMTEPTSEACRIVAANFRGTADAITRLDHHRDGGGE